MMTTCHIIRCDPPKLATKIAIANVSKWEDGYTIDRINVPTSHRGKGIGSKLLRMIIEEADLNGVDLYINILPSGDLNFDQLEQWYMRYGFVKGSPVPEFSYSRIFKNKENS